jgi:hypothetical protein
MPRSPLREPLQRRVLEQDHRRAVGYAAVGDHRERLLARHLDPLDVLALLGDAAARAHDVGRRRGREVVVDALGHGSGAHEQVEQVRERDDLHAELLAGHPRRGSRRRADRPADPLRSSS